MNEQTTRPAADGMLRLDRVNTFYGASQVHYDLTLEVRRGQIVCLLGGNASGKSTAMKVVLGLVKPRSGSIAFDGTSLLGLSTPQIVRLGLGSVPEARRLFAAMTVRENVLMGAYTRRDKSAIVADYERLLQLFPRLKERSRQQAGTLSGGEQQMVAMARALMGRPRLICMDEPTMGLSPRHVERVLAMIARIKQHGVTVFMVEQNAHLALQIADYGYVLQTGEVVLHGSAKSLRDNELVQQAYLGEMKVG